MAEQRYSSSVLHGELSRSNVERACLLILLIAYGVGLLLGSGHLLEVGIVNHGVSVIWLDHISFRLCHIILDSLFCRLLRLHVDLHLVDTLTRPLYRNGQYNAGVPLRNESRRGLLTCSEVGVLECCQDVRRHFYDIFLFPRVLGNPSVLPRLGHDLLHPVRALGTENL